MEKIKHQGISPFNPDPVGYKVFRNVKVSLFLDDWLPLQNDSLTSDDRTMGPLATECTTIQLQSSMGNCNTFH